MIGMLATILAIWGLLLAVPRTPIARALHAMIVAAPAGWLNRLTAGHVALVVIAAVAIGMVAWAGEGDAIRMLAMAAPDAAAWLATFEVTAFLDVAVTGVAAWSAARLRWPASLSFRSATPRRRRIARKDRPGRPPANDDEPGDRRRCA